MLCRLQRRVASRLAAALIVAAMAAAAAPAPAGAPRPAGKHVCQCPRGAHDCHCPVCSALAHAGRDGTADPRRVAGADRRGSGSDDAEPSRVTSACRLPDDAQPPAAREPFTLPQAVAAAPVADGRAVVRAARAGLELCRPPEVPPPRANAAA